MKLLAVTELALPGVKVIRLGRYRDERGYFTELWRRAALRERPELSFLREVEFLQANESFSRPGTVRGLHFQWDPPLGKLVRTVAGRMLDLVLDIRKGSPTFGRALAYAMPADPEADHQEWIWVPPGFAHGNCFAVPTQIEYLCSGAYNPQCEAGISPFAADVDWSLCDPELKAELDGFGAELALMSEKDRRGFTLAQWASDPRSQHFVWRRGS
jgi:dTDP-4-dehydrorhamnose 3,5-epimerase